MLVKVKGEIIRMNHPTIRPAEGRAPAVTPATAKRWLDQGFDDQGRPVVILDTRNDYEVNEGTFKGAIDWRLSKFTEFPDALMAHKEALKDKTIISFCTGGIRCEKAAIFMQQNGLPHTYQLEGGILKYFEETDGSHYEGGCFVFDERRAVDISLETVTPLKLLTSSAQFSSHCCYTRTISFGCVQVALRNVFCRAGRTHLCHHTGIGTNAVDRAIVHGRLTYPNHALLHRQCDEVLQASTACRR
jgi:predicted sulfurtransferase